MCVSARYIPPCVIPHDKTCNLRRRRARPVIHYCRRHWDRRRRRRRRFPRKDFYCFTTLSLPHRLTDCRPPFTYVFTLYKRLRVCLETKTVLDGYDDCSGNLQTSPVMFVYQYRLKGRSQDKTHKDGGDVALLSAVKGGKGEKMSFTTP